MKYSYRFFLPLFLAAAVTACTPEEHGTPVVDDDPEESVEMNLLDLLDGVIEDFDQNGKISRVFIVAHRGNTYEGYLKSVPDNSIPNIELAIKHGADMVELDVRPTSDNELILMHNPSIDATTTGTGDVSSLTLEQIKSYDMKKGSKVYKDADGNTTKVPTLKEALLACKDRIYVNLDIAGKSVPVGKLVRIIQECGMQNQVMLYTGGDASLAKEYQYKDETIAVHPQISSPEGVAAFSGMPGAKLFQYSNTIYINNTISEFGTKVHRLGYASYSNLLDDYDKSIRDKKDYTPLDKFIASGSDFVQTDICELVDEYLSGKGLRKEISGKEEEEGDDPSGELVEGQLKGVLPAGTVWPEGAEIGVFTDCDDNLPYAIKSGAATSTGVFEGGMSEDATVFGAYYPYSEYAGEDMSDVKFTIPASLAAGESPAVFALATYADGQLTFKEVLSRLQIKLSNVSGSTFAGKKIQSVTLIASRNIVGTLSADVSTGAAKLSGGSNTVEIALSDGSFSDGIVSRASIYGSGIKGGDKLTVKFDVEGSTLSTEIAAGKGTAEGEEYVVDIDASEFEPKIEVEWAYGGLGTLERFTGQTPAIDGSGNVYFTAYNSTMLYKLSPDGGLLWNRDIGFTGNQNTHPALEADGSVIYATGGSGGKGAVRAFNPDGSTKWSFSSDMFWGNGATPAPNFNVAIPAVGPKNIYVGNAGTTGTVITIDKDSGKRVSYVSGTNGTGGPSGGVYSGIAITKGGHVAWFANYGMYTAEQALMDNPVNIHETFGAYAPWSQRIGYTWSWKNSGSGVACSTIDGKDVVACVGIEGTTSGTYNMRVVAAEAVDGSSSTTTPCGAGGFLFEYKINGIEQHDNGGICVGARGEFIVSLKGSPAAIYAVSPDGSLAYKYEFEGCKDVTGCCAVDNNGYVHVLTDDPGVYHILKPDYANHTCEVVAEANLYQAVVAAGIKVGTAVRCRAWASPMIGDDGRMYAAVEFNKSWSEDRCGMLLCLSYPDVKGYCRESSWPMKGGGPRHDGNQK